MTRRKYVAYVGSYSYIGDAKGITMYDVDIENGKFKKRCEVEVDNSSYVVASHNFKTLYSIADEGIVAFRILENGAITRLNVKNIKGMRGCHLSTDKDDRYIFVSGYHDGKVTALTLNPDGSVGGICDGVYHKGLGSIAERGFSPHISCTKRTPEGRFVMAADPGIDQVTIYRFDDVEEKLLLADAIRCDLQSGPRCFTFSKDGKFLYLMYEMKNVIDVFTYSCEPSDRVPQIEKIQTIPTTGYDNPNQMTAATCMTFTEKDDYVFCGNTGDNTVALFKRDAKTGRLECLFDLPVSGEYPKDITIFPDGKHIVSVNHESGSLTFFTVDYENKLLIMNTNEIPVNQPNCCVIVPVM
jgi:6-phosphogluconolactonase